MKIIKGISRHQILFNSLNDQLAFDNPVRIIDTFVEKPDPIAIGLLNLGITPLLVFEFEKNIRLKVSDQQHRFSKA